MSIISIWIIAPRLPHTGLQSPKFTNKAIFLAEVEENVSKRGNSVIFSWRSTDGNCGVLLRHELFYLISTPQDCCWKLQSYPIMAYWRKKTSILPIHTCSLNQQLQGLFGFQSHTSFSGQSCSQSTIMVMRLLQINETILKMSKLHDNIPAFSSNAALWTELRLT